VRRVLILNAIAFPVIFLVMLVVTGTWSSVVVPSTRNAVVTAVGADTAPPVPASSIDSLSAADLTTQHARLVAVRDSVREERGRLVTERQELRLLTDRIEADVRQVKDAQRSDATGDISERESLARIFQEMDPQEAVEVLRHLDDASVEYVVKTMQRRHAAAVLAELEPEHAARLSARMLTPRRDSGEKERP
jgi:flagellar motility protein MotE (MotC chaperone)